jgi:hypothetical protein
MSFFYVGTLQFERYLMPAVALTLLAAVYDRRYWLCYLGVSVTLYLNFAANVVGCHCFAANVTAPGWLGYLVTLDQAHRAIAAANMGLLGLALMWFIFPPTPAVRAQHSMHGVDARNGVAHAPLTRERASVKASEA